jgi:predicted RNase H-like HicB family nuclease
MKYVYPVIFEKENGRYYVTVPDLSGCHTVGDDLQDAIEMARDAIEMWLCIAEDRQEEIPQPTATLQAEKGFISWIDVDTTHCTGNVRSL